MYTLKGRPPRRSRRPTSCMHCHERKVKCDLRLPCSECLRKDQECHYANKPIYYLPETAVSKVVDRMTAEMDIYKSLERYWRALTQAAQLGRLSEHTTPTTSNSILETGVPSFLHIKAAPALPESIDVSESEGDERSTHARHVLRAYQAYLRVSASHYTRALASEPAVLYWKLLTNAVYGRAAATPRSKTATVQCGTAHASADSETASAGSYPVRGSHTHRFASHSHAGRLSHPSYPLASNAMDVTETEPESAHAEPTAHSGPSSTSSSSSCTAPIASAADGDSLWHSSEQSSCPSPLFTPRSTLAAYASEHPAAASFDPLSLRAPTIDASNVSSSKLATGPVSPLTRVKVERPSTSSASMSGVQPSSGSATPVNASHPHPTPHAAGTRVGAGSSSIPSSASAASSHPTPSSSVAPRSPLSPDDISTASSSRQSHSSRLSRPCSHASSATCAHSTCSDLHTSESNRSWSDIEEKYDPSLAELHAEIESGFQFHSETKAMCALSLAELVTRFEFAVAYLRGCVTLEWHAFARHLGLVSERILQCLIITRRPELELADPDLAARVVDSVYLLANWYARNQRFGALTGILLMVRNLAMDVNLDVHCPLSAARAYIALVWWSRNSEQREEFFNWGMRYLPEVVGGDWLLKLAYVNSVVCTEASTVDPEDELWRTCIEFLDSTHTLAHLLDQSETIPAGTASAYKIYIGVLRAEMSLRVDAGAELACKQVSYFHKLFATLSDDETLLILQYLYIYMLQTKNLSSVMTLPDGTAILFNDFLAQQLNNVPTMPLPKQPTIAR